MAKNEARLKALETRLRGWVPWLRIIQELGQSREEVIADWEARNGRTLGEDSHVIMRVIEAPKGVADGR